MRSYLFLICVFLMIKTASVNGVIFTVNQKDLTGCLFNDNFTVDIRPYFFDEKREPIFLLEPYLAFHENSKTLNGPGPFSFIKTGDIYMPDFAEFSAIVRRFTKGKYPFFFFVSIKDSMNRILYKEFFCESNEDVQDYLVSISVDTTGTSTIEAGELVLKNSVD